MLRSHFGSSHFLFERACDFLRHELFWFSLVQVSTTQLCWFPLAFMAHIDDASHRPEPISLVQLTPSNLVFLMVPALTLTVWSPALVPHQMRRSIPSFQNCLTSMCSSHRFLFSRVGCLEWNHMSQLLFEDLRLDSQSWNRTSALSAHACARSKQVQSPPQVSPARQDLGPHFDRLTAPQPQGPMTQSHLKKTGT